MDDPGDTRSAEPVAPETALPASFLGALQTHASVTKTGELPPAHASSRASSSFPPHTTDMRAV